MLGLITDVSFMRNGVKDSQAGIRFARHVRMCDPYLPIIVESTEVRTATVLPISTAFSLTKHLKSSLSTLERLLRSVSVSVISRSRTRQRVWKS